MDISSEDLNSIREEYGNLPLELFEAPKKGFEVPLHDILKGELYVL